MIIYATVLVLRDPTLSVKLTFVKDVTTIAIHVRVMASV